MGHPHRQMRWCAALESRPPRAGVESVLGKIPSGARVETIKILQIHNRYLTGYGGEDSVLEDERRLLLGEGHEVQRLLVTTREADVQGWRKARTAFRTVWSPCGYRLTRQAILAHRPDVVHVHNTFPVLSPSVYWAAKRQGKPVVQTLHNYRLICANALLMRNGGPCEDCVGRFPSPGLKHRCYKGSLAATAPLVAMQGLHRFVGTYARKVDVFVVMTEFQKALMVRAGLRQDKLFVKPNFVQGPFPASKPWHERKPQIVFVGKLVPEKGVDLLIEAWIATEPNGWRLAIVGDGPEREQLHRLAAGIGTVDWLGRLDRPEALQEIAFSRFLAMPSRCYETFGLAVAEALAVGTPAICHDIGVPAEVAGSAAPLVCPLGRLSAGLEAAATMDPATWQALSARATDRFEGRFASRLNGPWLAQIYEQALRRARG